jgi:hypothetical protein
MGLLCHPSLPSAPDPAPLGILEQSYALPQQRSQEGQHWGNTKGMPGFWAAGPGCGLFYGEQARPKGQALAFADLARGLGAVDVAHMRSALG